MNKGRRERQQKKKFNIRKIGAAVVATILVVAMVMGLVPESTQKVLAAERISDLSTITKYTESLGNSNSTEYAGRIWTDKTVWAEDSIELEVFGGEKVTVTKNDGNVVDEDFLVGFSALATSQSISGQTQAPLDVVFVIDMSASMRNADSAMDGDSQGRSRMYHTVQALNAAIEELMKNPNTRVAVVGFNRTAFTLLPLDHYTKNNNQAYFSLSNNMPTDNNVTLYTRAVGSNGSISESDYVQNGTNIQGGLYHGMQLLAEADTVATIDGNEIKRTPSVVLLSDGSPTWAMDDDSDGWWAPESYGLGTGNSAYPGVGMLAMMTGAYMKNVIDEHYGLTNNLASKTTLYTIGMGIEGLVEYEYNRWGQIISTDTSQRDLARVTLNPKTYFDATDNEYAEDIKGYWEDYLMGDNVRVSVSNNGNYTLTHPRSNDIIGDEDALKNYVDAYYNADDAASVTNVFNDIVNSISISAPEVPTEHDSDNPMSSGYITYTDPIGEYMEVKDFKAIIYGGHKYVQQKAPVTEGNVTTYEFTEIAAGNDVYGSEELSHIIIEVTTTTVNGIKSQVLTIKIPASLIPLRVNTVMLNSDGTVRSHTNNGAYPIRILYTVGLQDAVKTADNVKLEALSDAYLAKHLNEDGTVDFYSNLYTGTNIVNGRTAGDATVVFDAASTNPFYYMQQNAYLYTNEACTDLATSDELDATTNYYYKETFYVGTQVVTETTVRTGAQLTGNTVVVKETDENGNVTGWYRPAGTPRVNRMLEFEGKKQDAEGNSTNITGTAEDFYAPTYNGTTGRFTVYLGNNGKMSFEATGSLEISKTVEASAGLTAPDATFTFEVSLKGATGANLTGEYNYTVTDAEGHGVYEGTISNGGTITLKAGQTAKIIHLPPKATYTVKEINLPGGFKATEAEKAGEITGGDVVSADFINTYSVTSVEYPAAGGLTGKKVLEGRNWSEKDSFTFFLTPYNNAPLPEDYDSETGVTVTSATNNEATFEFGSIEFTTPGVYRYTIYEREPDNNNYLPGMSYSRALYRVEVTVVDDGDGTMTAIPSIQKLYEDDATPLFTYDADNNIVMNSGQEAQDDIVFTNTYSAQSVTRVPVALKDYTDNSGQKPLVSGMFEFKLTPLGRVENNVLVPNTAGSNPMPVGEDGKLSEVITENEGHNVTFLPVVFTEDDIPEGDSVTYRYQMQEVLPSGANADNNYTANGMKYDPQVVVIDVTVSKDAASDTLIVNAVYPEGRIATFENVYTPSPISIEIAGVKTLTGRDMKDGENFEFSIVGANAATNLATGNGTITIPDTSEVSVSGGKDGEEVDFTFGTYTFNKPGTFTFNITETKGNAGGVTYDEHTCTVTVVVTDNNGQLEAAVTYSDDAEAGNEGKAIFNNIYTATFDETTAISLEGTKELTGRPIIDGEFYFDVEPQNEAPVALAEDVYVPAAGDSTADENGVYEGAITFLKNVTYDKAGTYVYKIYEVIPTDSEGREVDNGVTYDRAEYTVTVTVIDNLSGKLEAAITKIEKSGQDTPVYDATTTPATGSLDGIVFKNVYEPDDAEYAVTALHKVLAGNRPTELQAGEFQFVRTILNANPADGIAFYKVDDPTTEADESLEQVGMFGEDIVSNQADGTVQFGKIKFTKAGTYQVQIKEVIPADANKVGGVTYDTHVITATLTVTDDLNGNLVAVRTALDGGLTFRNTYVPTGTLSGSTNLNVTKVLDLDDRTPNTWGEDDKFTFVLEAADEATAAAIANGTVVLPSTNEDTAAGVIPNIVIDSTSAAGTDDNTTDKVYVKTEAFGDITFYAEGTYKFIIRELAGTEPGMDYDTTASTITVTTTDVDSDGELVVAVVDGSQTNPTFTNVYDPNDVILAGHGNLNVNKVFTGRPNNEWLDTDSFTFTLSPANDKTEQAIADGNIVTTTTELVVNKENVGHAHFGNITFTKADTYQFVIREVEPTAIEIDPTSDEGKIKGVTYDEDLDRIVEVVVTEQTNQDNQRYLTVAINYANSDEDSANDNAFTFTNTYDTTSADYGTVGVTKNIVGRNWKNGDVFTFTLKADNEAAKNGLAIDAVVFAQNGELNTDLSSMELTVTYDPNSNSTNSMYGVFDKITFYEPGVYEFVIAEEGTDTANMTYDKHTEVITIEVVDNGDGTLSVVEPSFSGTMTWENTHIPSAAEVTLIGTKRINGRDMTANDRYYFAIVAANSAAESAMPATTLVQNNVPANNEATISFGPIAFTKAGTYEYYIYEQTVNTAGITSDTGYVRVTVEVAYDDATGVLTVGAPTYTKVNSEGSGFEFINNYSTTGVLDGSLHLNVTKNFTGRENDAWLLNDEFRFTLAIDTKHTDTAEAYRDGYIILPENASGITIGYSDLHKQKAFGDITFTKEGKYQFIVTEIEPSDTEGIKYDENASRTIIVDVKDNGVGTLTATVAQSSESLVFTNVYDTVETELEGATNLVVEKKINGREWITADTYTFILAADLTHTPTQQAINATEPTIIMPTGEGAEITITDETPNYMKAFGDITFKEPGTYRFVITEKVPEAADKIPGVSYATLARIVTVNVVDNHDGTMTASVVAEASESLVFVNTYTAASTSTNLVGTKKMSGRDLLDTDKFKFTISVAEGSAANTPLPAVTTVENAADGTITFATITYDKAGTYKYVITEDIGNVKGVVDATNGINVTVEVVDENVGQLRVASVVYDKADGNNKFVYTNRYTTEKTDPVSISATKKVEPKVTGNNYTMKAGDFGFIIIPDDNNKSSDPIKQTTVYNDKDGNVVFANDVEYIEPGKYVYVIREVSGNLSMTYDDAEYTVTIDVQDDYANAKLKFTKTITKTKGGVTETVTAIAFENIYNPDATSAIITGTKKLNVTGSDKQLEDKEFTFKLTPVDGAPMPEGTVDGVKLVTNTAGTFSFGSITYEVPNTYKYKVTEVADDSKKDYIKYDDTEYEVIIKVEDVGGKLQVTENSLDKTPIKFENDYTPVSITLKGDTALKGKKNLDGRDLEDKEFTFQLISSENGEDKVELEAKNDADGNFKFEPLTFEEEGTFYYIIKEVKGTLGGVTYDETAYTVKIVVEDEGGYLAADVTYYLGEKESAVEFNNTYEAAKTDVTIGATKKLSGRKLRANEFTFILMDKDGKEIETVKNAADGTISFKTIKYKEEGTYVYKVAEVKGEAGYITYDENVYEITVKVTDNKKGNLEAKMTVKDNTGEDSEQLVFNNVYTPADAKVTLSGTKVLTGRDLKAEEFTFVLKDKDGKIVATAKNAVDGKFTFDELVFTQVGVFQYVVEEDSSASVKGITYDTTKFDVVIVVTDNEEGKLVAEVSGMEKVIFNNVYDSPGSVETGDTSAIIPTVTMLILSVGYILVYLAHLVKARRR